MSHIVKFKIDGLAGRKDVYEKELNREVNIFFGANGSGKTSLLRILDSAMTGDASTLQRVHFASAEVSIYSIEHKKLFTRSIKKEESEVGRRQSKQLQLSTRDEVYVDATSFVSERESSRPLQWITKPAKPKGSAAGFQHIFLPAWRSFSIGRNIPPGSATYTTGHIQERETEWDITFANRLDQLWTVYINRLLNEVQSIQTKGLADILRNILAPPSVKKAKTSQLDVDLAYEKVGAFLSRQGAPNVLGSKRAFGKRYSTDLQLRGIVNNIDSVEQSVESALASRNELQRLIENMFTGNKGVQFGNDSIQVFTEEGISIGLASLSSGEKQALRIFIETLRAGESTLLIDEPEISLHIDWQKRLISGMGLLNPDAQLILATHSPDVMADIPDEDIFSI